MKKMGFEVLVALLTVISVVILIEAVVTRTINQNRGYPASESQIKDNTVYYVFASFEQRRHNDTNLLAVLGEVEIFASDDYRHSTTNRFFQLKEPLINGQYYRAAYGGRDGQVSFTKIGSPMVR